MRRDGRLLQTLGLIWNVSLWILKARSEALWITWQSLFALFHLYNPLDASLSSTTFLRNTSDHFTTTGYRPIKCETYATVITSLLGDFKDLICNLWTQIWNVLEVWLFMTNGRSHYNEWFIGFSNSGFLLLLLLLLLFKSLIHEIEIIVMCFCVHFFIYLHVFMNGLHRHLFRRNFECLWLHLFANSNYYMNDLHKLVQNKCEPLCEIQAKVSKYNNEITSIKVWFLPLISI